MLRNKIFKIITLVFVFLLLNACGGDDSPPSNNAPIDTTLPTFMSSNPSSGESDIATNTSVSATFSEALAQATVNGASFTLVKTSDSSSIAGTVTTSSGDTVVTFTPSNDLGYGTQYTVALSTAITDVAGNAFAGTSWSFTTVPPPTVEAFHSAAPDWNDYVKTLDTGMPCDGTETGGYSACIHGGEKRSVEVPGYSNCTNLSATDALGALNWICQIINTQAYMVSTGLRDIIPTTGTTDSTGGNLLLDSTASFITDNIKVGDTVINTTDYTTTTVTGFQNGNEETGLIIADDIFVSGENYSINMDKNLSDLIDFDSPGWKSNSVTVLDGNTILLSTVSSVWWANPVATANTGGSLSTLSTIYLVTTDPNADYSLDADKVALVVKPGVWLTGAGSTNIVADSQNFLWLEGKLEANGQTEGIFFSFIKFSVLRGFEVNNADYNIWFESSSNTLFKNIITKNINLSGMTTGIYMNYASDNTFENVVAAGNPDGIIIDYSVNNTLTNIATSNNTRYGISTYSSTDNNLSNIIASNNAQHGIYLQNSSNNNLTMINANNNDSTGVNGSSGIYLDSSSGNTLSDINADNNGDAGVYLIASSNNILSDISTSNNLQYGVIFFSNSQGNNATNIIATSNNGHGVRFEDFSDNNTVSNVKAVNNSATGIRLDNSSGNNLSNISASTNSEGLVLNNSSNNNLLDITTTQNEGGIGFYQSSNNNVLTYVTASNNDLGIYLQGTSSNNSLMNVIASNNVGSGVSFEAFTENNSLSNVTAANNEYVGVYLTNSSNNNLSNITAVNNHEYGIILATSSNNSLSNITSSDNGGTGISIGNSSNNYFTGILKIGNNSIECLVSGGTDPGLVHLTCENSGSSNATLTTEITLASSFAGKLTIDDTVNTSDTDGSASFPADPTTFDWTSFENNYRSWGIDGSEFPDADHRGIWLTGTGSIWDWSLDSNDTVIRNVLIVPDGNDIITHTWSDASTTIHLRNAVEIVDDTIGNDNGLCETNEVCLYTPNIGSYQGHGELQSTGTFTDGIISGVILLEYPF